MNFFNFFTVGSHHLVILSFFGFYSSKFLFPRCSVKSKLPLPILNASAQQTASFSYQTIYHLVCFK